MAFRDGSRRFGRGCRVAASLALIAVSLSRCGSTQSPPAQPVRSMPTGDSSWLGDRYEAARSKAESLPGSIRARFEAAHEGFDVRAAFRLHVGVAGRYWLVRKGTSACVVGQWGETLGSTCRERSKSPGKPLAIVIIRPEMSGQVTRAIVGIVPAGKSLVCVEDHGASTTLDVHGDGVFFATDHRRAPPSETRVVSRPTSCTR
jgi:hypothetical protein